MYMISNKLKYQFKLFTKYKCTRVKVDSHLQVCSNKKKISRMIQKCMFTSGGGDKNMAWFVDLVLGLEIHLFAKI